MPERLSPRKAEGEPSIPTNSRNISASSKWTNPLDAPPPSTSSKPKWTNPLDKPGPSSSTASLPPRPVGNSDPSKGRSPTRLESERRYTSSQEYKEERRSKSPIPRPAYNEHDRYGSRGKDTYVPSESDTYGRNDRDPYDPRDRNRGRGANRDYVHEYGSGSGSRTDRNAPLYPLPRNSKPVDRRSGPVDYESDWERKQREERERGKDGPVKRKYSDHRDHDRERDRDKDRDRESGRDRDRDNRDGNSEKDVRYGESRHRERTTSGRHRDHDISPRKSEDGRSKRREHDSSPRKPDDDPYKRRRRSRSRSRSKARERDRSRDRTRTSSHRDHRRERSRTRTPDAEEGEIHEDPAPKSEPGRAHVPHVNMDLEEEGQVKSDANGPSYLPIKIRNRPTKRLSDVKSSGVSPQSQFEHPSQPPPTESQNGHSYTDSTRPATPTLPPPPPPPAERPPTPPAALPPPPPTPPQAAKKTPSAPSYQPRANKVLDSTKAQGKYDAHGDRADGKSSVPHAPNRNLLNPNTRPSTPAAKSESSTSHDSSIKLFTRPTAAEELRNLQKSFVGTTTLAAYDLGDKLGEGTFGVVTKGVEIATKRAIALKKLITHNPRDGLSVTTVREIKIIKSLNHPNIVEIIDMVVERENPADRSKRGDVFMVFPYMDHDLCGLLSNADFKLHHSVAKLLMRQILQGMDYIHANNFIHRDIKTANILVDRRGEIKIADFGLARTWTRDDLMPKHLATEYTNMVVTRWYRAPELLLGDRHYGPAVDMWSLGCVLGEMYHRLPILQGESDRDQLFKIFGKIERPSEESFPGWDKLPGFPDSQGYAWDKVPEDQPLLASAQRWSMEQGGADLMMQLLRLDPVKRLTANDALDHPWFWTSPLPAKCADGLIPVESSHEMTQKIKNEPPPRRAVQPQMQAHRPRQSFPLQHQQQQHMNQVQQQYHHQQQQQQQQWNGRPPMGMGMPNGNTFQNMHMHPNPNQNANMGMGMGMGVNPYANGSNRPRPPHGPNMNGISHGPGHGFPNRPFNSGPGSGPGPISNSVPGLPNRPPVARNGNGGNPYVPAAPFALRASTGTGRPPGGPRSMGMNGGPRPPGSGAGTGAGAGAGSGQTGLPY